MEEVPSRLPRIGYARRSYRFATAQPAQKNSSRLQRRLQGCCVWSLGVLILLPILACVAAVVFRLWVFDLLNPPFVPPAHAQQCGSFDAGTLLDKPAFRQCFWLAYQTCHTAVLSVGYYSADDGETHNFLVEKQENRCTLSDYVQTPVQARSIEDWIGLGNKLLFVGRYQCKGLQQVGSGLRFEACGSEGNIDLDTGQSMSLPAPTAIWLRQTSQMLDRCASNRLV